MGAGPTGLFAASELGRRGHAVRLVEREIEPHRQVRASSVQARTLEIFEALGIHERVLAPSERLVGVVGLDQSLAELYRTPFSGADTDYRQITILPQWHMELLLQQECERHGVSVERGVTATVVEAGDEAAPAAGDISAQGTLVRLEHADGRVEDVRVDYLLDATGAHSQARHALHEALVGGTYRGTFAVADCELRMPGPRLPRDTICLITGSGTVLLSIPLPHDRWLLTVELADDATELPDELLAALVAERSGGTIEVLGVGWRSVFHAQHRIAAHLGDGRHFLLGDAGHLSSPFGGEGLNAGLHDAFDIAWKLDLVLRGRAMPSLLDTYSEERLIADEHVVEVSDAAHSATVSVARDPASRPAATDPAVVAAGINSRFMLDIDYSPSPLVLRDEAAHAAGGISAQSAAAPRPGTRLRGWEALGTTDHVLLVLGDADADALSEFASRWRGVVEVRTEPPASQGAAGLAGPGLLLVRPDGHVAARLAGAGAAEFGRLHAHLATHYIPA